VPARREQPRHRRAARHTGAERDGHGVRASDIGSRPPARHGQNDRAIAIGRKNYLFAGSDASGRRAAALYSLIESAKLNGLNPQHYLADVLARIADHPARRIAELLPWNWQPLDVTRAAA
jgi:transposase IS66-like protein